MLGLRERAGREFALFSQVEDICRRAKQHERVKELDEMAEHQQFRDEYYEYAYECAMDSRVPRKLFQKAVEINVNYPSAWQEAAVNIAIEYDHTHPCIDWNDGDPKFRWHLISETVALRYFDFYRFAIEPHVTQTVSFARSSEHEIQGRLKSFQKQIAGLLSKIPYYDIVVTLGNYPDEQNVDKRVHGRFLDLSLDVYHQWWKTFDPEDKGAWEQLQPYVEDIGSFADKAFGTYSEHFDNYENIEKYNQMLESQAKRARELVNRMVKWNDLIKGKTVQLKDPASAFQVEADLENGVVTIKKGSAKIAQMQLLVEDVTEGTKRVAQKVTTRTGRVRWRKVKVPVKFAHFELEPSFKEVKLWPAWLGVFGQVLSLTVSTIEMIKTFQEKEATAGEEVVAVAKVAKDTFEIIDGFSAALHATFPYAEDTGMIVKFAKVGEKFKGPGLVLEAILNVHDGAEILILDENSLSASAVRRDDVVEGWLQESKGLVLVASAVPGAVAAGGTLAAGGTAEAALGAAIPPLGLALAVAGLIVVGINIAIYIRHGPTNIMDDLDKALDKAKVREFGDFFDTERTVKSLNRFSKTADRLSARIEQEKAWQASTK